MTWQQVPAPSPNRDGRAEVQLSAAGSGSEPVLALTHQTNHGPARELVACPGPFSGPALLALRCISNSVQFRPHLLLRVPDPTARDSGTQLPSAYTSPLLSFSLRLISMRGSASSLFKTLRL